MRGFILCYFVTNIATQNMSEVIFLVKIEDLNCFEKRFSWHVYLRNWMKYGKVVYILDVSMKILNKAVTRSRKSNKDIYNKMNKREREKKKNNGSQITTQKTKHWATKTQLKSGNELICSGRVGTSWSTIDTRLVG
jgi:hypothetical protein